MVDVLPGRARISRRMIADLAVDASESGVGGRLASFFGDAGSDVVINCTG